MFSFLWQFQPWPPSQVLSHPTPEQRVAVRGRWTGEGQRRPCSPFSFCRDPFPIAQSTPPRTLLLIHQPAPEMTRWDTTEGGQGLGPGVMISCCPRPPRSDPKPSRCVRRMLHGGRKSHGWGRTDLGSELPLVLCNMGKSLPVSGARLPLLHTGFLSTHLVTL